MAPSLLQAYPFKTSTHANISTNRLVGCTPRDPYMELPPATYQHRPIYGPMPFVSSAVHITYSQHVNKTGSQALHTTRQHLSLYLFPRLLVHVRGTGIRIPQARVHLIVHDVLQGSMVEAHTRPHTWGGGQAKSVDVDIQYFPASHPHLNTCHTHTTDVIFYG